MRGDLPRISRLGCFMLVVLRLAIGWHLMYEGLWKLSTQHTSTPWTAEGYLKNSTGPLRTQFRDLTGDPNDLKWLDYDEMSRRWDDWYNRFVSHYPGANDAPENGSSVADRLSVLINGPDEYSVRLDQLPEGVDLSKWKKSIYFDAKGKRLVVTREHLLPSERDAILALVESREARGESQSADGSPSANVERRMPNAEDPAVAKFKKAVNDLYNRQSKLSYKERLAALLKGDPDRTGTKRDGEPMGKIDEYKTLIARYEANLAKAKTAFQWDHLQRQWTELQQIRRELVSPVQALDAELRKEAESLLSEQQLAAGPVPEPMTEMRAINLRTMWGLAILGGLLIAGLFTRLAALGSAALLTLFYLAVPPWPGTPPEVGPEHNFIVNKVLVEAIACLALVFLPTGRWFGVDALFAWMFGRRNPR